MSDQVKAALGAPPWLPTQDTQPVETLSYYDGPLLGIFRQHGVPYLFRCLVGQFHSVQIWLYAPLTDWEVDALQQADGEVLDELVEGLSISRQVTVALADDTAGLLYTEVEDTYGLTPADLPFAIFERMQESVRRISERTKDLAKSI